MESKKETYRIRAVRRRDAPIEDRRVADEEIVHELWCRQEELEACLAQLLGGGDAKAELKAIYDADGVLVEFAFDVPGADVTDDPPDRSGPTIGTTARRMRWPA